MKYILSDNSTLNKNYKYFGRNKIKVLLNYIYDGFRVRNRKKFLDKYFLKEFSKNKKCILFTLSVEAESAILFDAPFYINQVEVVKNIAKALPAEFTLLVKEHPASGVRSLRSTKIYQELIDIPNVVPIHYSANMEELIKKSSLVMSICSSSSLDALFLRKPTIIFGNTDFSMISDVKKIGEIEKLPEIIKNELKREVNPYMQFEITRLAHELGITTVYVTHDQTEALTMSDRVAVFEDGRIQQLAPPDRLYEEPENSFVAQFIGENNTLEGVVKSIDGDKCIVTLDSGAEIDAKPVNVSNVGERTKVSIRPERVEFNKNRLHPDAHTIKAEVKEFVYMGDIFRYRLSVAGNDDFVVKTRNAPDAVKLSPGDTIDIGWLAADCRALDA